MPGLYGLSSNANISVYNTTGLYNLANANIILGNVSGGNTTGLYTAQGNVFIPTSAQQLLNLLSQQGNVNFGLTAGNAQVYAYDLDSNFYSNANVAAFLPTYTGSLEDSSSIINLWANAATQSGQIVTVQNNLTAFETYANIHFGDSNYGNANVAAYLPTYGGVVDATQLSNIGLVNVASQGTIQLQYDPTGVYNPYDIANGSWLYIDNSGMVFSSNVNGTTKTAYFDNSGNLQLDGNVTASYFIGDGSKLTNLPSVITSNLVNGSYTLSLNSDGTVTVPVAGVAGNPARLQATANIQVNANGGIFEFQPDGYFVTPYNVALTQTGIKFADGTEQNTAYGNTQVAAYLPTDPTILGINANVTAANAAIVTVQNNLTAFETYANLHFGDSNYSNANVQSYMQHFDASIIPSANVTYSLGSPTLWWKDLYLSNNTLYLGGESVALLDGNLAVNGVQVTNTYGNANVAVYLPSDPTILGINANVTAANATIVTVQNNLTAFETYANLHFGDSNYSNVNVAAYIPTDPTIQNIQANLGTATNNITTLFSNAATQATAIDTINANVGAFETYSNVTFATKTALQTLDANVGAFETYANTQVQTINANLGAFQTYANIHFGDSNYGNANVAAYLPVYGGNIIVNYEQANSVILSTTSGITGWQPGQLAWDPADETVSIGMLNGVTLQVGQEQYIRIKASAPITNGQGVMFTGANGDNITAAPNDVTSAGYSSSYFIGVATQDIANNAFGYITTFGKVHSLNTNSYTVGDILYASVSTPGALTATEPAAPGPKIQVAAVVKKSAGDGHIFVRPTVYPSIAQLSDVQDAAVNYDYLRFNSTGNIWQPKSLSSDPLIQSIQANIGGSETYANVTFATKTELQTLDANIGAFETYANLHFGDSNYGNANVAAYLPTYTGNIGASYVNVTNDVNAVNINSSTLTVTGLLSASYGINTGGIISTGDIDTYTNFRALSGAALYTDGGVFWTNGAPYSSGGTYGNVDVAAYLPVYGGDIVAGNVTANYFTSNVDITANGNVYTTGGVFWANGDPYGAPGTYGNIDVAAYLPVYGGDIVAGNVTANYFTSNLDITANGNVYTTGGVFWANGDPYGGGGGTYGNVDVAAYLPTYTGNIGASYVNVTNDVNATGVVNSGGINSGTIYGTGIVSYGDVDAYADLISIGGAVKASTGFLWLGNLQPYAGTYANSNVANYLPDYGVSSPGGIMTNGAGILRLGQAGTAQFEIAATAATLTASTVTLRSNSSGGINLQALTSNINLGPSYGGHISDTVAYGNVYAQNRIVTTNGIYWANGSAYSSGGGSQTPWTGNIDGAGYYLSNSILTIAREKVVALGNQSGVLTFDFNNGGVYTLTATGNITINGSGLYNSATGQSLTIIITQDLTGSRLLTSDLKYAGGSKVLSTAPGAVDMISIFIAPTAFYASLNKGFQ